MNNQWIGRTIGGFNAGYRTALQTILGVFNGCFYTDPTTGKPTYANSYPGGVAASDIMANVIDDPGAYTEPWTVQWDINWNDDQELQDYVCQENNKFLLDMQDDEGNPFFDKTSGL